MWLLYTYYTYAILTSIPSPLILPFSTILSLTIPLRHAHYPSTPRPLSLYATPTPVPAQVQNVRVYVFYPIRNDTSLVTAQVVWDGLSVEEAGGMLTGYSIDILNAGDMSPVTASNVLVSGRVCVWVGVSVYEWACLYMSGRVSYVHVP